MEREQLRQLRSEQSNLFGENKIKLGIFALNCSGGNLITTLSGPDSLSWPENLRVIQLADELGLELALPLGRFKGQGGVSNHNGATFEVFTWAAAMAQATKQITCFATSHVALVHPLIAAKQAATIDHISGGRFGLNVVMGWFAKEMAMFGTELSEHDDRYRYGDEWIEIVKRLWSEVEPFDFRGKYFSLDAVESLPKPIQKPGPILVNAGTSKAGIDFTARHVDVSFGSPSKPEDINELAKVKSFADREYNRDLALMCSAPIICRETEREAKEVYHHILDKGDWAAADEMRRNLGIQSRSFEMGFEERAQRFVVGYGANPIVGSPEQVADQLMDYHVRGMDGVVMYFLDYHSELKYFGDRVLPLLKQAGLRV
ncbi:LLM class flavin-dependent oxidoreductase [Hyphomicrobiales bacterium]|nr:LLM class flavin-dependent oxidoreductase [Hyphomicrobiales bacterium]CAH1675666.1 LLM class flavin-dependent oxidoreductase [Hyphomicrobiales bacterium]